MVGKGLVELELVSVGIENLDAAVVVKEEGDEVGDRGNAAEPAVREHKASWTGQARRLEEAGIEGRKGEAVEKLHVDSRIDTLNQGELAGLAESDAVARLEDTVEHFEGVGPLELRRRKGGTLVRSVVAVERDLSLAKRGTLIAALTEELGAAVLCACKHNASEWPAPPEPASAFHNKVLA
jgi:hypothetical protein